MALGEDRGLLLGIGVQLVVSCTAIEAQIVFETLLALVAGQLAIAGQLGREVHPWSIELLLRSGGWKGLGEGVLDERGHRRRICLALGGIVHEVHIVSGNFIARFHAEIIQYVGCFTNGV